MWNLQIRGTVPKFDAEAYMKAVRQNLEKEAHLAARAFAVTALARIPTRTGFVASAFMNLTDLVGGGARFSPVVSFTRSVLRAARNFLTRQKAVGEYYYPPGGGKILKSAVSGRQFGTAKEKIFTWEGGTLTFTYDVDVTYFRVNDNTSRIPSAPWGAFAAGQLAFENYMQKAVDNPKVNPEDFIVQVRIG